MDHKHYRERAQSYDRESREYGSHAGDVLFGMCHEYIRSGEHLLDLGIGTGLASVGFQRAGLRITGLDQSEEMLAMCRAKCVTQDLHLQDLSKPLPFADASFDHLVCCGVLHFLSELQLLLAEMCRVTKPGGLLALTYAPGDTAEDFASQPTAWGVPIWKHTPEYMQRLLGAHDVELLKEQHLLLKDAEKKHYSMHFAALVCRKA